MKKALLIVDEERRRFLGLEGRQAFEFAARLFQCNLAPHHLADGKSRSNFIKNGGIELHRALPELNFHLLSA